MTDDLEIPPFLRREMTPEIAARLKRLTARYREPKIKNPPKRISKKHRTGLGPMFGSSIKGW